MNKVFNERLLHLARRLNHLKDVEEPVIHEMLLPLPEEKSKIFYSVRYRADIFWELPLIFKEWHYDEREEAELKFYPGLGLPKSCLKFFGINPSEFTHLFDVEGGYQDIKKFGGVNLHPFSPFADFGFNITEFLKRSKN